MPGSVATLQLPRVRLAGCSSWRLRFAVYSNGVNSSRRSSSWQWDGICAFPFRTATSRDTLLSAEFWSTTSPSGGGSNVTPRKFSVDCDCDCDRPTTVGGVDETYIRVKGKWVYLYRAVDSSGATIDFLLSAQRDAAAAERFLGKALGGENHRRRA